MSTVMTKPSTCVVLGVRARARAVDLLGDVPPRAEAELIVLGVYPTEAQRRVIEEALALADERRFVLTARMVTRPDELVEPTRAATTLRLVVGRRERRLWELVETASALSTRDDV
jgi:hypothetical protein